MINLKVKNTGRTFVQPEGIVKLKFFELYEADKTQRSSADEVQIKLNYERV